jgi:hypothetical protein
MKKELNYLTLLKINFFEILTVCFSVAAASHRRHFLCSQEVDSRYFDYPSDEFGKENKEYDPNKDKRGSYDSQESYLRESCFYLVVLKV